MTRIVFTGLGGRQPVSQIVKESASQIIEAEKSQLYNGASKWVDLTPDDSNSLHGFNCGFIRSIIHPHDEPKPDDSWMGAGREALYAYVALSKATTIGAQGQAMRELDDAMSDLASFFPEYDFEAGIDSVIGPMEE